MEGLRLTILVLLCLTALWCVGYTFMSRWRQPDGTSNEPRQKKCLPGISTLLKKSTDRTLQECCQAAEWLVSPGGVLPGCRHGLWPSKQVQSQGVDRHLMALNKVAHGVLPVDNKLLEAKIPGAIPAAFQHQVFGYSSTWLISTRYVYSKASMSSNHFVSQQRLNKLEFNIRIRPCFWTRIWWKPLDCRGLPWRSFRGRLSNPWRSSTVESYFMEGLKGQLRILCRNLMFCQQY